MILLPVTRGRSLLSFNNLEHGLFRVTCWEDGAGWRSRGPEGAAMFLVPALNRLLSSSLSMITRQNFTHFLVYVLFLRLFF